MGTTDMELPLTETAAGLWAAAGAARLSHAYWDGGDGRGEFDGGRSTLGNLADRLEENRVASHALVDVREL